MDSHSVPGHHDPDHGPGPSLTHALDEVVAHCRWGQRKDYHRGGLVSQECQIGPGPGSSPDLGVAGPSAKGAPGRDVTDLEGAAAVEGSSA